MGRLYKGLLEDPAKSAITAADYYAKTGDVYPLVHETSSTALGLAGVGMPFAGAGQAGVFGGRLAKTADLEKLTTAEGLAAKGAAPEDIWTQTGWFQGPEGKWRFEIPDVGTGFRPQAPLPQRIEEPFSPGQPMLMEHAYAHPDLYEAYPQLRSYLMKFEDPVKKEGYVTRGGLDPYNREVFINPEAIPEREAQRSTLLHELQHAVQREEGFAKGGSPYFPEVQRAADTEIAQRKTDLASQRDAIYAARDKWVEEQQAKGITDDQTAMGLKQEYFKQHPEQVTESARVQTQLYNLERGLGRMDVLQKHYRSLGGEVEARNVQARADMPTDVLRDLPPAYTQDVPYSKQLIRMGDALGLETGPASFTERMAALKDAAFERAQKGTATGDYGLGTARRTAPEAPKGSMEAASDRLMSSLRDTQRQLQEYKNPPAKPLLAPGERPQDLYFSTEPKPTTEMTPIGEQYVLPRCREGQRRDDGAAAVRPGAEAQGAAEAGRCRIVW